MASEHLSMLFAIVLLGSGLRCQGQHEDIKNAIENVFLSKSVNASEGEEILKNARESFQFLNAVENPWKSNFAKNYANFLAELLKNLGTKDVREIFSEENSFLKDYKKNSTVEEVNLKNVQTAVEEFQTAAERVLIPYYNSTEEIHNAVEILSLTNTSFDDFVKEKLHAEFPEIGYFLLEVFATLVGLSWGIISTVVHVTENMDGV